MLFLIKALILLSRLTLFSEGVDFLLETGNEGLLMLEMYFSCLDIST